MALLTLFTRGLEAYLTENEDREGDLWLFQHLPKTAGSSIRTQMFKVLRPATGIDVKSADPSLPMDKRRSEAARLFIEKDKDHRFRCAGGHLLIPDILKILRHRPGAKPFTLLRHPVDRVVSDYNYFFNGGDGTAPSAGARQAYPTLQSYVSHGASQNKFLRYLAPAPDMSNEALASFVETTFVFIGLQDRYAASLKLLGRLIGSDLDASKRLLDSSESVGEKAVPTQAERQDIAALNHRDMFIYDYFRTRLEKFL